MNQTANYQLNQWAKSDRIQMEDFNADNLKLEQALGALAEQDTALEAAIGNRGNCKIVTGTYTGTGGYGSGNRNTLTFAGTPLFLAVCSDGWAFSAVRGGTRVPLCAGSANVRSMMLTWTNGTVKWYNDESSDMQLNEANRTYHYVALLATD